MIKADGAAREEGANRVWKVVRKIMRSKKRIKENSKIEKKQMENLRAKMQMEHRHLMAQTKRGESEQIETKVNNRDLGKLIQLTEAKNNKSESIFESESQIEESEQYYVNDHDRSPRSSDLNYKKNDSIFRVLNKKIQSNKYKSSINEGRKRIMMKERTRDNYRRNDKKIIKAERSIYVDKTNQRLLNIEKGEKIIKNIRNIIEHYDLKYDDNNTTNVLQKKKSKNVKNIVKK